MIRGWFTNVVVALVVRAVHMCVIYQLEAYIFLFLMM